MKIEWNEYNKKIKETWPEGLRAVWVHLFATDNVGLAWFMPDNPNFPDMFIAIGTYTPSPYEYKGDCDVVAWAYADIPDTPEEEPDDG